VYKKIAKLRQENEIIKWSYMLITIKKITNKTHDNEL
jgi:hypothetical protein